MKVRAKAKMDNAERQVFIFIMGYCSGIVLVLAMAAFIMMLGNWRP